jgi:hypothetical protein
MNLRQDIADAGHRGRRPLVPEAVGPSSLNTNSGARYVELPSP